jgi:predicted transcriptional regulator
MTDETTRNSLLSLTADVVGAYVAKNAVPAGTLTDLIGKIHQALLALSGNPPAEATPSLVPAVPIKRSITPDYIVSLEDGRKFKSMKRHLGILGMTPAEYRAKWDLPKDYPMVAPNYAAQRSELAKKLGLGRKREASVPAKAKPKSASKRVSRP